ncbi:MAG: hypothetical protein ACK4R9_13080 [Ignavibacterium sp.]
MKKIFSVLIIGLLSCVSFGQIKNITLVSDYSFAQNKRLQITKADAVGALVSIKVNVIDNFNFTLSSGYKLYSLNEPDVLTTWDWDFWTNRYYPKILSDLRSDPNLSVEIGAVQKMDLIPVILLINYDFQITDDLSVTPSVGGGVYFYTRRMFATETWSKRFPQADYTLTYSYRNFAPDKKGNPFFSKLGFDVAYNLLNYLDITASSYYTKVFETEGSMGFDMFPFSSELSFNLGLSFKY